MPPACATAYTQFFGGQEGIRTDAQRPTLYALGYQEQRSKARLLSPTLKGKTVASVSVLSSPRAHRSLGEGVAISDFENVVR